MHRRRRLPGAALAAALLAAAAPAAAQTLSIGIGGSITSADPHFYNAAPNAAFAAHVFDRLVERDARAPTRGSPRTGARSARPCGSSACAPA